MAKKHQQCIYWDAALECVGLRIYPSGRRVYVCSYRIQKRKRLACLGRADILTIEQARKKAQAYLGKVAGDEDPQAEPDRLRTLKTMHQLCTAYVTCHAKPTAAAGPEARRNRKSSRTRPEPHRGILACAEWRPVAPDWPSAQPQRYEDHRWLCALPNWATPRSLSNPGTEDICANPGPTVCGTTSRTDRCPDTSRCGHLSSEL
jgi:hypothetical protein